MLNTDDTGIERLSGQPNLAAGDYRWQLNARDAADQHVYRAWKFRVLPQAYQSLEDLGIVAGHTDLVVGTVEDPDPSDPTISLPADDLTTDWADFISSTFDPDSATASDPISFAARNGIGVSLNLADGATAPAFVDGNLVADKNAGGGADVDVFRIGALTPDSVLEVTAEGTSERATGIFNKGARRALSPCPRHHQTAGDHACRHAGYGWLRRVPESAVRQLLPRGNRSNGRGGSLQAELAVPAVEHSEILPAPRPPIGAATPRTIGVTGYGRCSLAT